MKVSEIMQFPHHIRKYIHEAIKNDHYDINLLKIIYPFALLQSPICENNQKLFSEQHSCCGIDNLMRKTINSCLKTNFNETMIIINNYICDNEYIFKLDLDINKEIVTNYMLFPFPESCLEYAIKHDNCKLLDIYEFQYHIDIDYCIDLVIKHKAIKILSCLTITEKLISKIIDNYPFIKFLKEESSHNAKILQILRVIYNDDNYEHINTLQQIYNTKSKNKEYILSSLINYSHNIHTLDLNAIKYLQNELGFNENDFFELFKHCDFFIDDHNVIEYLSQMKLFDKEYKFKYALHNVNILQSLISLDFSTSDLLSLIKFNEYTDTTIFKYLHTHHNLTISDINIHLIMASNQVKTLLYLITIMNLTVLPQECQTLLLHQTAKNDDIIRILYHNNIIDYKFLLKIMMTCKSISFIGHEFFTEHNIDQETIIICLKKAVDDKNVNMINKIIFNLLDYNSINSIAEWFFEKSYTSHEALCYIHKIIRYLPIIDNNLIFNKFICNIIENDNLHALNEFIEYISTDIFLSVYPKKISHSCYIILKNNNKTWFALNMYILRMSIKINDDKLFNELLSSVNINYDDMIIYAFNVHNYRMVIKLARNRNLKESTMEYLICETCASNHNLFPILKKILGIDIIYKNIEIVLKYSINSSVLDYINSFKQLEYKDEYSKYISESSRPFIFVMWFFEKKNIIDIDDFSSIMKHNYSNINIMAYFHHQRNVPIEYFRFDNDYIIRKCLENHLDDCLGILEYIGVMNIPVNGPEFYNPINKLSQSHVDNNISELTNDYMCDICHEMFNNSKSYIPPCCKKYHVCTTCINNAINVSANICFFCRQVCE